MRCVSSLGLALLVLSVAGLVLANVALFHKWSPANTSSKIATVSDAANSTDQAQSLPSLSSLPLLLLPSDRLLTPAWCHASHMVQLYAGLCHTGALSAHMKITMLFHITLQLFVPYWLEFSTLLAYVRQHNATLAPESTMLVVRATRDRHATKARAVISSLLRKFVSSPPDLTPDEAIQIYEHFFGQVMLNASYDADVAIMEQDAATVRLTAAGMGLTQIQYPAKHDGPPTVIHDNSTSFTTHSSTPPHNINHSSPEATTVCGVAVFDSSLRHDNRVKLGIITPTPDSAHVRASPSIYVDIYTYRVRPAANNASTSASTDGPTTAKPAPSTQQELLVGLGDWACSQRDCLPTGASMIFPLNTTSQFLDHVQVSVPRHPLQYLRFRYGFLGSPARKLHSGHYVPK